MCEVVSLDCRFLFFFSVSSGSVFHCRSGKKAPITGGAGRNKETGLEGVLCKGLDKGR